MAQAKNQFLEQAGAVRRGLTGVLQWVVILLMAALVLDVCWGVASRYLLGQQAKWSEELARLLLVWVSVFGASVAFGHKAHLGLDYFAEKLHPSAGKFNRIIGASLSLAFAVIVFLVGGIALVRDTMESGQTMIALPIKKWWAYAALPASGVFMAVILFEQLLESIFEPAKLEEGES
ncbi:TRAP transporter small permease [Pelagicoccus sp. SDUM812003]|uniref:TRAP transporter small permease n=1 Tax=Pelagicoccus sp. SDUM812003 TaxID=3041267 RepID=UPI00280E2539|nr:TRAP transporter small permease [Pelagicoccus sp. SDUM812003]MDQ8205369.1 TRAP transporter small permease [Pelagicoccus sp. SDUM812003]